MEKVYVIWNPLLERVVCVHSSEEKDCVNCEREREKLKNTAYSLQGKWFLIDSNDCLCYCGNKVDTTNPDCVEYNLCKEHQMDV